MRRVLLVAALACAVPTPASAAASAKCTRVGAVRVVKKVRETCTYAAGRLVWQRPGASGAAATPAASTLPAHIRVHNALSERRRVAAAKTFTTEFDWVIAPTIAPARREMLKGEILEAYKVWADAGGVSRGITILVLDEHSEAMFLPYADPGNCQTRVYIGEGTGAGFLCGMGSRRPVFVMMIGSAVSTWDQETLHHEVAHLGQAALLMRGLADDPAGASQIQPCWIFEAEAGVAQKVFAGAAATTGNVEYWRTHEVVGAWRQYRDAWGLTTDAAWVDFLVSREDWGDSKGPYSTCFENNKYRYGPVVLIYERLYADFDYAKILSWRISSATRPWGQEFERIFGMTPRAWYASSVVPYIKQQLGL